MVLSFLREKSKSRSGKHSLYANAFEIEENKVTPIKAQRREQIRPLYKRGEAERLYLKRNIPSEKKLYVQVWFIRNLRGKVKGTIKVYSQDGDTKLEAKYKKLKVRRSSGDPSYGWAVVSVMDHLKLPVKRYNFNTGSPPREQTKGG